MVDEKLDYCGDIQPESALRIIERAESMAHGSPRAAKSYVSSFGPLIPKIEKLLDGEKKDPASIVSGLNLSAGVQERSKPWLPRMIALLEIIRGAIESRKQLHAQEGQ